MITAKPWPTPEYPKVVTLYGLYMVRVSSHEDYLAKLEQYKEKSPEPPAPVATKTTTGAKRVRNHKN